MHRNLQRRRHTPGIAIVDFVETLDAGVIERTVPQQPRVGLGRSAKQLRREALEMIQTLHKLRGCATRRDQLLSPRRIQHGVCHHGRMRGMRRGVRRL